MQANKGTIADRAFGGNAAESIIVTYKSHQDAVEYLHVALRSPQGAAVLQGPAGSGKSTVLRAFGAQQPPGSAVALVDGARVKSREFLSRALAGFGHESQFESNDELYRSLTSLALRRTREGEAPMLIVDNVDQMYPSALATLNELAELQFQCRHALRIVVSGRNGLDSLIESGGIGSVEKRCTGSFLIHPMSHREALLYLHARLTACGINDAATVFPIDVCERLYQQSGGWPGSLNRQAVAAIGRAKEFPVALEDARALSSVKKARKPVARPESSKPVSPSLIVSKHGEKPVELPLSQQKVLIGRSDFADVVIPDYFVSKLHAVILAFSDALVLMDLNSSNGTTVNSVPVSCTLLKDDDIISIGTYRIKVQNVPPIERELSAMLESPDTIKMKTLMDLRRVRARRLAKTAKRKKDEGSQSA